ncbi:hypothetical protein K3495_g10183 [Podosphaera aphanis]|nr:hypothetical protein K3495_g10183 [Podosphaera aphanis]
MMSSSKRASAPTRVSIQADDLREASKTKKDMWSTMLDSVASGRRLPEKTLLVLGGTPELQREFLENLTAEDVKAPATQGHQNSRRPPVANDFPLGFTYHDVLDADHEDALARISIFLLSDPSPSFTPLLQPLLTPKTIPNTLIIILLDWSQPWFWLRQLQAWIRLLRTLLVSLDAECKSVMEEVMLEWRDKTRNAINFDRGISSAKIEKGLSLPLGPGEWEEALGLPLCVVCQNSDQIEVLEKEQGWKEQEFDFVLQILRTVLLKHGASLIYTAPSMVSSLQSLIHSSLGIHSLLKRQPLKHNVIDRDKVLIPPNWDSWGKIRVLSDGFEVEAVNDGWSLDIEEENISSSDEKSVKNTPDEGSEPQRSGGAVDAFEKVIRDPSIDSLQVTTTEVNGLDLEVSSQETQEFLAAQLEILEKNKAILETHSGDDGRLTHSWQSPHDTHDTSNYRGEGTRVNEHIGPVQFNMGGIHVDADNMIQQLKDNKNKRQEPVAQNPQASAPHNEALASFFEGLMHRSGINTASNAKAKPL